MADSDADTILPQHDHTNGYSPHGGSWWHKPDKLKNRGLPLRQYMGPDAKNHFVAWLGEYTGTTMYLFFAFAGTMVAHSPGHPIENHSPIVFLYIAVTFAFYLVGNLSFQKAFTIFTAQMLGGMSAAAIVSALLPVPLSVGTTLSPDTNKAQGLFIEAFVTFELVFTVFMLAAEKHRATFLAPIGIGIIFFVIELVSVRFTGGSANPTRSFGPAVAARKFEDDQWIYWVGPAIGAAAAAGFYRCMKMLEYENANPGQDSDQALKKFCDENPGHSVCEMRTVGGN
ncbi:Similar to Aquaporin-1; acc. no. P0CD92 [Pyronema omphalodes CBS 100304]|nr:Similar to Aquaporin-1; acc. no. P0CD92 [Pyronema omphalodes CBS 100304]